MAIPHVWKKHVISSWELGYSCWRSTTRDQERKDTCRPTRLTLRNLVTSDWHYVSYLSDGLKSGCVQVYSA